MGCDFLLVQPHAVNNQTKRLVHKKNQNVEAHNAPQPERNDHAGDMVEKVK